MDTLTAEISKIREIIKSLELEQESVLGKELDQEIDSNPIWNLIDEKIESLESLILELFPCSVSSTAPLATFLVQEEIVFPEDPAAIESAAIIQTILGFGRIRGKSRIYVSTQIDNDPQQHCTKPWAHCKHPVKSLALMKVPDLLLKIRRKR